MQTDNLVDKYNNSHTLRVFVRNTKFYILELCVIVYG